ncbi:hypothetical protein ID866_2130 [Astraeus odoratus]|nr:hypothetical protein ID866_2130 [Astraeus odoratus]
MSQSYSTPSIDPFSFSSSYLASSASSCSSPSSPPPPLPAYNSDSPPGYYLPDSSPPSYSFPSRSLTTLDVKRESSRHSSISSSGFPDSGIDLPLTAPLENPSRAATRITIAHPYARLYAKKDGSKRRKIWNHVLEKQLFSPQELSTMGAPHRRTIYMASLEAHIDRLHNQLLSIGLYPIPFQRLEPYRGLNSKTAKSMVAGLQYDATQSKLKLLELERSNTNLSKLLGRYDPASAALSHPSAPSALSLEADVRRHSVDLSGIGMGTHSTHANRVPYYSRS